MVCIISFLLGGCGTNSTEQTANVKTYGLNETVNPAEGMSITVTNYKLEPVKGDKTQFGENKENGEYYLAGKTLLRVADYKKAVYDIEIKNDTNESVRFANMGWSARNSENSTSFYMDLEGSVVGDVAEHSIEKGQIALYINNKYNPNDVLLSYNYLNYGEEWTQIYSDLRSKAISIDEYRDKVKAVMITWKIAS
jgi:hypothetical protein